MAMGGVSSSRGDDLARFPKSDLHTQVRHFYPIHPIGFKPHPTVDRFCVGLEDLIAMIRMADSEMGADLSLAEGEMHLADVDVDLISEKVFYDFEEPEEGVLGRLDTLSTGYTPIKSEGGVDLDALSTGYADFKSGLHVSTIKYLNKIDSVSDHTEGVRYGSFDEFMSGVILLGSDGALKNWRMNRDLMVSFLPKCEESAKSVLTSHILGFSYKFSSYNFKDASILDKSPFQNKFGYGRAPSTANNSSSRLLSRMLNQITGLRGQTRLVFSPDIMSSIKSSSVYTSFSSRSDITTSMRDYLDKVSAGENLGPLSVDASSFLKINSDSGLKLGQMHALMIPLRSELNSCIAEMSGTIENVSDCEKVIAILLSNIIIVNTFEIDGQTVINASGVRTENPPDKHVMYVGNLMYHTGNTISPFEEFEIVSDWVGTD
ncbi:hypothetical protein DID80_05910 [Candidatus Marinamargulisbacteria bacterium SCGC AAA071-K20]|nr:hypothetical protein DID80_05910 [Candidatus Marinamargulisbacteria bacterium SCGC AAA071-K20]